MSADELLCRPATAVAVDGSLRAPSVALVSAVAKGEAALSVERLLQQRADPDSVDPSSGLGAVHVACMHNQLFLLSLLLSSGADIEGKSRDKLRSRPLHVAIRTASFGVGLPGVKLLLALGADPTASRADGVDCLALATQGSAIARLLLSAIAMWKAEAPKRKAGVSLALWAPSELPDASRRVQRAAIVHAAAAGRRARVEGLVRHTDPNSQDEHGITATHAAAARGDLQLLEVLLAAGASANLPAANARGARPLHCAALSGSVDCVKALLRAAADPSLADLNGHLPVERAASWAHAARGELLCAMERLLGGRQAAPSCGKLSAPKLGGLNRQAVAARAVLSKQGPVRVLLVSNRERPSTSANAEEPVAEEPSESAVRRVESEMSLTLAGVGVSLIDAEPCELLRASLQDVRIRASQSEADRNLEVRIGGIQVDCCIEHTKLPVVLQPMPSDEPERPDADGGDCVLHLVVTQNVRWTSLLYIERCEIMLLPMRLTLEQNMTARLLRLSTMLAAAWASALTEPEDERTEGTSPRRRPAETDVAAASELYLRFFKLHPVVVAVTVQMDALCDERQLQESTDGGTRRED
uniref:ANK_REP_REGION domain-containing protein n=1 Tax=Calcidiscus leptoporus TaxID=127549 RepID=A0A7S0ITU7_9EUKA